MASPLRDGSFDIAEIVLLTTPTSSIRLSPPELKRAGSRFSKAKPVASQLQVSAGSGRFWFLTVVSISESICH
jgi:hypothetical protein